MTSINIWEMAKQLWKRINCLGKGYMVGDMHNLFGKWLKVEDKNKVF